jgi:hypothetical protein
MHQQISSGTFDSPSWDILQSAKLAARIYAPLGTQMSLGDFVRLVRAYIDAFKTTRDDSNAEHQEENLIVNRLCDDLKVRDIATLHLSQLTLFRRTKANFLFGGSRMIGFVVLYPDERS